MNLACSHPRSSLPPHLLPTSLRYLHPRWKPLTVLRCLSNSLLSTHLPHPSPREVASEDPVRNCRLHHQDPKRDLHNNLPHVLPLLPTTPSIYPAPLPLYLSHRARIPLLGKEATSRNPPHSLPQPLPCSHPQFSCLPLRTRPRMLLNPRRCLLNPRYRGGNSSVCLRSLRRSNLSRRRNPLSTTTRWIPSQRH